MTAKLKIGKAEVLMRSNENGICIHFGKARCVNKKYAPEQKLLKKEERCIGNDITCPNFIGQSNFVPEYDDKFLLPGKETQTLSFALQSGDNILMVGAPGTGKTSLTKQLAAMLNWGVIQFSCSEETSSAKILGQWVVAGKNMKWADGYITTAMKNGYILLEDEADFMRPELRGEIHSVMEHRGTLTLSALHPDTKEPYQEVIRKHPDFRWVSTANTIGHGDDFFQYHGTQYMNAAARDRYEIIVQFRQKDPAIEMEILKGKTEIDEEIAKKMVEIANLCRDNQNKEITFQFSLRRLLSWANYWKKMEPMISCELCLLNFCNETDRHFLSSLIRTHIGIEIS